MHPIIRHQLAGARITVLAAWPTATDPAGYRPGYLSDVQERTSIMFQTIRGIARSLLITAAFAAVALTGQQAASAAALPAVHFTAPSHFVHFTASDGHFSALTSRAVSAAAPARVNW